MEVTFMSLRFIYGRAGSGKSFFCLNEIKKDVKDCSRPIILLVPEDFSFQAEKDLLNAVGEMGIINAQVLSFKRMAYKVFSEVGGLTREHMNNAGRCMLIYRIMDKCQGGLKVFKKAVKMKGFVNTISDMITELKVCGITPYTLQGAAEKIEGDIALKDKVGDIGLIFSDFENELHQKYIDSDDDLTILYERIDKSHMFDGAEIWVDGFSVFTPQQYRIIEKLMKRAARINVTLCMDIKEGANGSADVFLPTKSIEERIIRIARENNISVDEPVFLDGEIGRFQNNPELQHLEKSLYSFPYKTYDQKTDYIKIFTSVNKYSEVENTARDIVRLCRDEGFRYSDIAVVTGDAEGYEKLVGAIFSEYGIPYFLNKRRDINSSPLIVLILSAIEILSKNWQYESVFRYLKTGLLNFNMDEIDEIENYVLSSGIRGNRWTDKKPWVYWPESGYGADVPDDVKDVLNRINHTRENIYAPLVNLESVIDGGGKGRDICTALFNFLCEIGIPEKIEAMIDDFKKQGELDLAEEYSKVWNILVSALDQVVEVLGGEELSLEQFARVLSIGFDEYSIGLIPPSVDQVMFGGIERIKSHTVKALFIIGVNDGVFPSSCSDEGILSDSDRERLKVLGLELASDTRSQVFEEQFLAYTAFTRTSKYLSVSCPIANSEGSAMRPSILISRLKKVFPNITENSNILSQNTDEENLNLISLPSPTFNELVCELRKSTDGEDVNPMWRDVYRWYMDQDKWRDKCLRAMSGMSYVNQVKNIGPERIKSLYGRQLRFSISRLEKYAQCPFAYFTQYALKAKERRVYELSPPDIGSFIHTILDRFSTYLDENNMKWRDIEKEWCRDAVSDIVDKTVDEMSGSILSSSARYKYLKERLKRIILRAVWLIALHIRKGGFEPKGHEISFENGGKYPPISIKLPTGEKVSLIGRIDRMDAMETEEGIYVRIVDYKSGNKDFNLSDIYNGLELQLLIYLDAILEYASKNNKKPVFPGGILYFRIDDPIIKSPGNMETEDIEKEIMKVLKMKGLLLSDIKVIKEMDHDLDKYSLIIPAMLKSDGTLGSSTSAAGADEFEGLRKHVKNKVVELCEDMLKGNISISPYKRKNDTPCKFCSYKSICRFDVSIRENSYRFIKDASRDEIWSAIKQETSRGGEA
jgi:helicase-exonuclease AddAB, AddB subunit